MPKLTIYFTSDTHGYLYPTTFINTLICPVGLLGMRFNKDEQTLIIDGGDTIQGSPLTFYCQTYDEASPVADVLNAKGYDYVTLGNHDFNYGPAYLRAYLERLNAICLCANVEGDLPVLPACVRVMPDGLRVGIVGIVTDFVNRWEKPKNLKGLRISDPLTAAREAIAGLSCDVLIGVYHGGIERDLETGQLLSDTGENIACRLCAQLPFDLLLTGHQHIALAGADYHGTHIVQTPCNGRAYARVTLQEDGSFVSELITPCVPEEYTPQLSELKKRLDMWLDKPIGRLDRAIWPQEKLTMALCGTSIADFFNIVQLHASGADVSCAALGNDVRGFSSDVTVRDVVSSYVYSNTLVVLRVNGRVLRRALERCAEYFDCDKNGRVAVSDDFLRPKEAHYNYDYFMGIEYEFDLRRSMGSRVSRLTRKNKPIQDEDELTLCLCDYRASGSGGYDFYRDCPHAAEISTDMSELILQELQTHELITLPDAPCFRTILPDGSIAANVINVK